METQNTPELPERDKKALESVLDYLENRRHDDHTLREEVSEYNEDNKIVGGTGYYLLIANIILRKSGINFSSLSLPFLHQGFSHKIAEQNALRQVLGLELHEKENVLGNIAKGTSGLLRRLMGKKNS